MTRGVFQPVNEDARASVRITFDGRPLVAMAEDTILAALLRHDAQIGNSEFDGAPRAGFCLMGSCQECTLWSDDGQRLRACMTGVRDGMILRSTPYAQGPGDD
ncbi:(2Fe-2S)-binding protein [Roseovarius spongiae]|uniref:(2Fe-2S)-binding protein n=1 Tax=Roseovarius spongiae TaxID=2320272 RepID=A0A3A8AVD6_9RHOB|nr:(2Fe-2S)-binding protein [Roseovarius spongiae]RKF14153.1 (2Fe-2S)-binding protein [Roseovarius spongiae]